MFGIASGDQADRSQRKEAQHIPERSNLWGSNQTRYPAAGFAPPPALLASAFGTASVAPSGSFASMRGISCSITPSDAGTWIRRGAEQGAECRSITLQPQLEAPFGALRQPLEGEWGPN